MWDAGITLFIIMLGVGLLTAWICWYIWGRRLRAELSGLLYDRDNAKEKLREKDLALTASQQQVHTLTNELEVCSVQSQKADQAQILEASLAEQKRKMTLLTEEGQSLSDENKELQRKLDDAKAQLDVSKYDKQHLSAHQETLEKSHDEKLQALQKQLSDDRERYEQLQASHTLLTQEHDSSRSREQELERQRDQLKQASDEQSQRDNDTAAMEQAYDEKLQALQKQVNDDRGLYEQLQASHASLTQEHDGSLSREQALASQCDQLKQSFEQLQRNSDTAMTEKAGEWENSLSQLKAENLALNRKLLTVADNSQDDSQRTSELEASLALLQQDKASLNQNLEQVQAKCLGLESEQKEADRRYQDLNSQHQTALESLAIARALNERCEACEENIQEAQEHIDICENKIEELAEQLEQQGRDLDQTQASLSETLQIKAKLEDQVSQLQAEAQATPTESAEAPKESKTRKKKPRESQDQVLARIKERAEALDFERIGTSTEAEKDALQRIKGIGPFIELKLNSLGIYTFKQIAQFNEKDEELVNEAIEFFPGRVRRDEWVKQAKAFVDSALNAVK